MKTYIITGAAGFLGNTIVRQLLARGERVRGLVLAGQEETSLRGLKIGLVTGNMLHRNSLRPLFMGDGPFVVIHAASMVSISQRNQDKMFAVNVGGVRNLLALCKEYPVERLVYISSVHSIPEQPNGAAIREVKRFSPALVEGAYAKSKAEASALVMEAARGGLHASIVHPSGIIGPGDYGATHLTQMVLDYLAGRLKACVTGGYDFVDVRDVATGVLACEQSGKAGEGYILSNRYYTVKELLDMLHRVSGLPPVRTVLPFWLANLTAPLAETYYKCRKQPPLFTRYSLYTLRSNGNFSHAKATREFGYNPRPLEDTLRDTLVWLQQNQRL